MIARRSRWWGAAALFGAAALGLVGQYSFTAAQQPDAAQAKKPVDPQAVSHANELSRAFRTAATNILPSVVTIETSTKSKVVRDNGGGRQFRGRGENPFKGTPFEQFFDEDQLRQFGSQLDRQMPRQDGAGSGVIIDKSGVVLTNNHVVSGADVVTVRLADGREFKATDVKTDPHTDLAIVHISGAGDLPAAKMGNSDALEIGDWVIAVGNPFGLEQTVSAGIISGKGRQIGAAQRTQFLQTDAAINPGNSGGPLVNLEGEVIGINTAIASNHGGNEGIGFAVPVNLAKWVAPQLMAGGRVERAYLGVGIEQINPELAAKFGVKLGEGVLVTEVFPDTPAQQAGLHEGDVILSFSGTPVNSPRQLQEVVERSPLGSKQPAKLLRDGKPMTIDVTAQSLPKDFGIRPVGDVGRNDEESKPSKGYTDDKLGLEVTEVTPAQADQLGFGGFQGVLIAQVEQDSPAYEAGLREGMLIRKVGNTEVAGVAEFRAAVAKQSLDEGLLLMVRTQAGNRYVVIEKP